MYFLFLAFFGGSHETCYGYLAFVKYVHGDDSFLKIRGNFSFGGGLLNHGDRETK